MGDQRTLRAARSEEITRAVSGAARSEPCAASIAQARAVEALRNPFRAWAGIDRTHRSDVCRARHQSPAASRKDPRQVAKRGAADLAGIIGTLAENAGAGLL